MNGVFMMQKAAQKISPSVEVRAVAFDRLFRRTHGVLCA